MSNNDDQPGELDISSTNFNALAALTTSSDQVKLPNPNARVFDNMTWFVETENGIFPRERVIRTSKKNINPTNAAASNVSLPQNSSTGETSSGRKRKEYSNVLTRMDKAVGPLSFLKKCLDQKLRVKVYIRSAAQIRGFCLGFVEAFDKHMNLVLKDVYETWKRPRRTRGKIIEAGTGTADKEKCEKPCEREESETLTSSGSTALHKYAENGHTGVQTEKSCYQIPRWIVKRRTKKKDICERHVHQLLIRGEQVVTVMLEQSQS